MWKSNWAQEVVFQQCHEHRSSEFVNTDLGISLKVNACKQQQKGGEDKISCSYIALLYKNVLDKRLLNEFTKVAELSYQTKISSILIY